MLVQIPLLALAGAFMVPARCPVAGEAAIGGVEPGGMSGILLALIASSWWMVPRALDLALASPAMEVAKFVTLPLLVGRRSRSAGAARQPWAEGS